MATNASTFEAVIEAVDKASSPLRAITDRLRSLTGQTAAAERQIERLDKPRIFSALSGNVRALHGQFGNLGAAIGGVHGRLAALFPALGGLAAVGSVKGLVGLVESVAERREEQTAPSRASAAIPPNWAQ